MSDSTDVDANRETEIPPAVGEQLRVAFRLDDRPQTLSEWGVAIGDIVDREGIDVELSALCTADQSPHEARFDGTARHFLCVQDAFIVPSVADDVDTVEITTESPVSGERIEVTVTDDGAEIAPSGAVMSVGVSTDLSETPDTAGSPEIAYGAVCPYGRAFRDRDEYERWAETVDAVTMAAPLEDAVRLARAIDEATQ